jgi:hypothetical protein
VRVFILLYKKKSPHPNPLLFEPEPQSRRPAYREREKEENVAVSRRIAEAWL